MTFKKYPKIYRLGTDEVEGILLGDCYIEEKIDGANTSIWLDKRDEITCGSRNRELEEGFNGFVDFVKNDKRIKKIMSDHPEWRLYGEWLVPHTVHYNETAYKKWYLFDIEVAGNFLPVERVIEEAEKYGLDHPAFFGKLTNPTMEELQKIVGKSEIGEKGEGIVIKNFDFVNKFGNLQYAKLVAPEFWESKKVLWAEKSHENPDYYEIYVANKYMTEARVRKILNKLQSVIDEKLDLKHIPRITNTCYHDLLTEEIWNIQKKCPQVNFRKLKKYCLMKAKQIFIEILTCG